MFARTAYSALIPQINQIAINSPTPEALVYHLNNFIFDNRISDKAISYTTQTATLASWNIACGSKWVNPQSHVGDAAAGLPNPTFNDAQAHQERMECCVAILNAMKQKGIEVIAIQEAPANLSDTFYKSSGAVASSQEKGNIRVALVGVRGLLQTDPIFQQLQQWMTAYGITAPELQIAQDNNGQYIINIHFDYKAHGSVEKNCRIQFLNDIIGYVAQNSLNLFVMGDSNLQYNDLQAVPFTQSFGAHGCQTVDVIMGAAMQQAYQSSYKNAAPSVTIPTAPSITIPAAIPHNVASSDPLTSSSESGSSVSFTSWLRGIFNVFFVFMNWLRDVFGGSSVREPVPQTQATINKLEEKIENGGIQSMEETVGCANGSRIIAMPDNLYGRNASSSPHFFGAQKQVTFNEVFGLKDAMNVYKGKTGMVQIWFGSSADAIAFESLAYQRYQSVDRTSAIVCRQDQPLVIRLSQKQYNRMCSDFPAENFIPYDKLPDAPTVTSAPQKKR